MTFRFIHASDLHIGRKFANIPQPPDGNIRGRLREARHGALGKIGQAAVAQGASHVLLAGDTFDTATPSAPVLRQALMAMGETPEVTFWLLPGNHDNLRDAEPLWEAIQRDAPDNVRAVTDTAPIAIAPGVTLLPCPVAFRAGASEPSAPLDGMVSPEGDLRIGLAHGGVTDFTESGDAIAPDRAARARLDYPALGDWHGRMAVSPRVQYSGSPEQDRFKHGRRGVCLAVTVDGPGAVPQVEEVETGSFLWSEADLTLHPRQDAGEALAAVLPERGRRDHLLRVKAQGWATLPDRSALLRAAEACAPDFAHFDLVTDALGTQYDPDDLDAIDRGGALRMAADALVEQTGDAALAQSDRDVAGDALARLYAYVREDEA